MHHLKEINFKTKLQIFLSRQEEISPRAHRWMAPVLGPAIILIVFVFIFVVCCICCCVVFVVVLVLLLCTFVVAFFVVIVFLLELSDPWSDLGGTHTHAQHHTAQYMNIGPNFTSG